ncbi:ABC transporter permease [Paenibacillus sinopodophylli]|uniref:ABC transporter permease n=1 Tax=Paenibacillus sinopodophylli TaxID=1837342 RepID=UPI001FE622AA|nr:ABC transporter permease [Paenibacillus sinopodophylli]
MMHKALSADFLKIRGKGLWLLIFSGPVGLIAMQALNYGLRYDYLMQKYTGRRWEALLADIQMFVPISLFLGVTLIPSLLSHIEHSTNAWKQLLALPISRGTVFRSKFALSIILLTASCTVLAVGIVLLGFSLRFELGDMPVGQILKLCFLPFFASLPAMALFLWLCINMKNQAIPITLGVLIAISSVFTGFIPGTLSKILPVNWPMLSIAGPKQELFVGTGFLLSMAICLLGTFHFIRKDVI